MTHRNAAALLLLAGLIAGCNNSKSTEPVPLPVSVSAPQPAPEPAPDLYTLDPTKHTMPTTPVAGRLNEKAFVPDRIELEGNQLTLRSGKEFFADLKIVIFLDGSKKPDEETKLVVKPSQRWTDGIPSLHVSVMKKKDGLPETKFVNDKYALTLELGKLEAGKIPGKIYLCLPDEGKSYLAGTFVAQRKRSLFEPPGADELPFIEGTVSPSLKKDQSVKVGFVGQADGKIVSNSITTAPSEMGEGAGRSGLQPPASLRFEKFSPRFDFTNLPPGRYLIYAVMENGPAAWEWVDVAEKAKISRNFKLDAANLGSVTVKVPEGKGRLRLVPLDLGTPPPSEQFLSQLSFTLGFEAEVKDGVATFSHVPEGKYQLREGRRTVEVVVVRGQAATVELPGEKK